MERISVSLQEDMYDGLSVMNACERAAEKAGWSDQKIEDVLTDMKSHNYDHLMRVANYYFKFEE